MQCPGGDGGAPWPLLPPLPRRLLQGGQHTLRSESKDQLLAIDCDIANT